MTLKTIKKKTFLFRIFVLFVSLSPSLVSYKSYMTLLCSKKGENVENLMFLKKSL